jgi:hypothetical protein
MTGLTEEQIHRQVCNYLHSYYPDVIFTSDLSGVRLHRGTAQKVRDLKSCRGIPDLLILEPVGKYHGLMIELKKDKVKVWKKNGDFVNEHFKEQYEVLERLEKKGFFSAFCMGYENAVKIIDKYMKGEL